MDLAELNRRAAKEKLRQKERQHKLYYLAKSLGFDYVESVILCNRNEKEIYRLAKEKSLKEAK